MCVCWRCMWCVFLCQAYLCGPTRTEIQTYRTEPQRKSKMQPECIYACLSPSLSPPTFLSLFLSLGSWPGTTISGNGFFCPKMKVKLFRAALINVFHVAPKSMLQFSFALCSDPKFPTRVGLCLSVCLSLCVCRGVGRE